MSCMKKNLRIISRVGKIKINLQLIKTFSYLHFYTYKFNSKKIYETASQLVWIYSSYRVRNFTFISGYTTDS
jgi:hypothetical protein